MQGVGRHEEKVIRPGVDHRVDQLVDVEVFYGLFKQDRRALPRRRLRTCFEIQFGVLASRLDIREIIAIWAKASLEAVVFS